MTHEERAKILASLPPRIYHAVRVWSVRTPDRAALVEAGGRWTYRELDAAVERARAWMLDLGIRPGDRVMIVCENCKALAAIFFALTEIGAWAVPVNARLSTREVSAIRQHCGARRVLYTAGVSSAAMDHARRDSAAIEEITDFGTLGIGSLDLEAETESPENDSASSVAAMIYTSGTTGTPKGVMLTHRNLLFAAKTTEQVRLKTAEDRVLGVLPLSHVTGLSQQFLGTLLTGATLYLLPRFDPMKVRAVLQEEHLTVLYGVPFLYTQFVEYAKLRGISSLRFPDLRLMSSSGAPLLPAVKSAVENLFGLTLQNGYGVSECSPVISITRIGAPRRDGSAGAVYPGVEVKIVGPDQNQVADGEVGEVWVRGPNVMKGYYRAPEETAKAINAEGWFNTQDLARMENGELFVIGRTKEMIIRFGFNVYPAEVETVLNMFPGVTRSAVVGRTIEQTGEQEIVAFVEPAAGVELKSSELSRFAEQRLAPYKRPTEIRFVPELPHTLSGKVIKVRLLETIRNEAAVGG
jgi:long-chain acyl-CoA synthetase